MSAEDEWEFDKSMGLLDASPEEYRAATGASSAAEILHPAPHPDPDLSSLRELQKSLWTMDNSKCTFAKIRAVRSLTVNEVETICSTIEQYGLLTEMFSANMFGGYGMDIFQHEVYPDTGPIFVLRITEYDLPKELNSTLGKASRGRGSADAWELFSKYTHSDKNKAWLKLYKMKESRERSHYDY